MFESVCRESKNSIQKYQSQDAPTLLTCFIIVPEMLLKSHQDQIKREKEEEKRFILLNAD